jgi:nucleotide-binding universal stress UspA family protein
MQILAATDFSTRSYRALREAGLLAQASGAELTIMHVIDDDQPKHLVEVESREAERILAEQIRTMAELKATSCRPMVIAGNPFDSILHSAEAISADLIVMGSHRKQFLRDLFVGTTIERVIRKGQFPVLMVNNDVNGRYRNAIAAVDISEPSANAIRVARSIGLVDENSINLLHALLPPGIGQMTTAVVNRQTPNEYVAAERKRATDELSAFLTAKELACPNLRVEEGVPFEVISRAVAEMRPDLLILGTRGRTGLHKVFLGSVTEEALRRLDVDILAVPPASPL